MFQEGRGLCGCCGQAGGLGGKGGVWLVLKAGRFRIDVCEKRLVEGKVPCKCPVVIIINDLMAARGGGGRNKAKREKTTFFFAGLWVLFFVFVCLFVLTKL